MASPNPVEDLLQRLREQLGRPLGATVEALVRRFADSQQPVAPLEMAQLQQALAAAEASVAALEERITALEARPVRNRKTQKNQSSGEN